MLKHKKNIPAGIWIIWSVCAITGFIGGIVIGINRNNGAIPDWLKALLLTIGPVIAFGFLLTSAIIVRDRKN